MVDNLIPLEYMVNRRRDRKKDDAIHLAHLLLDLAVKIELFQLDKEEFKGQIYDWIKECNASDDLAKATFLNACITYYEACNE